MGCSVIVKAHPAHLATSTMVAEAIMKAKKAERERVLQELSILIHEWEVVAEGTKYWSSYNRMYRKIESLRGEP